MFRLKVREIAAYKKISQRQLSLRSGVDVRTLHRIYVNEAPNVRIDTLARLAYALNCDVSLLMESNPELPKHLDAPLRPPPWMVPPAE